MSDRELLELAAKAAGYMVSIACCYEDGGLMCLDGEKPLRFSPLTDDGDALRLAVKLGMCVTIFHNSEPLATMANMYLEEFNGDRYAATRRAIVRAAAEIGKSL